MDYAKVFGFLFLLYAIGHAVAGSIF